MMAIPDKAITRGEQYLAAMAVQSGTLPDEPITRKEFYLAKAAGQDVETPEPITREEMYLDAIAEGGGGGDSASGTSVAANKTMVIPKVAGKSNFFACVDGDSAYITVGAALAAFRFAWLSETGVYSAKIINPGTTPPLVESGVHTAVFVTETEDSISIKFPNSNTVGSLPDGTTVRYMWW